MPILIADPTRMLKRLDYIESGARRCRRIHHKRRLEQAPRAELLLEGGEKEGMETIGLCADHCLMVACLGVELRSNGIMDRPTTGEVEYALRFGGFLR